MVNIASFCEVRTCFNTFDFVLATFLEGAFERAYVRPLAKYMNYSYFVICLKFFMYRERTFEQRKFVFFCIKHTVFYDSLLEAMLIGRCRVREDGKLLDRTDRGFVI